MDAYEVIRLEFKAFTVICDISAKLCFHKHQAVKTKLEIDDHRDFGLCAFQICDRQTDRQCHSIAWGWVLISHEPVAE